jgi:hypothetical protein
MERKVSTGKLRWEGKTINVIFGPFLDSGVHRTYFFVRQSFDAGAASGQGAALAGVAARSCHAVCVHSRHLLIARQSFSRPAIGSLLGPQVQTFLFAIAELQRIGAVSSIRTQLLKGSSISNFSTWTPRTPLLPNKVSIPPSANSNSSPRIPSSPPPDQPSPSPKPASPPPSPPKPNASSPKKTSTSPTTSPLASPTTKSATLPTSVSERPGGPQISLPPPSNGSTSTINSPGGPA